MTGLPSPISDATAYGSIEPTKGPGQPGQIAPEAAEFQSLLGETAAPETAAPANLPGPMEVAQKGLSTQQTPTTRSLLEQMNTAQDELSSVQKKLSTPDIKLKRSSEHILNNKLQSASKNLNTALQKLGAPPLEAAKAKDNASPVEKLLAFAADGQNQLVSAKNQLLKMAATPGQINPAAMMLIQVKLAQAQQAIEYASMISSKAIEAIKQTINVNI